MATTTVPTTITPEAQALAKQYGVERELKAILEQGEKSLKGLRGFHVEVEIGYETDPEDYLLVYADLDPAVRDDSSVLEWYRWPFDQLGLPVADRIRVTSMLDETPHDR